MQIINEVYIVIIVKWGPTFPRSLLQYAWSQPLEVLPPNNINTIHTQAEVVNQTLVTLHI
jgi:hypothetical protein